MKRFLAVFLSVACFLTALVGCSGGEDISGKEIAKMLLADERLDGTVLTEREGFSAPAEEKLSFNGKIPSPITLASINGSSFGDDTNMLDFFNSYLQSIEDSAQKYAELIENIKTKFKYTDVWVDDTLLHVTAGTETIFRRSEDAIEICHHYTNQNGKAVYEMYERYDDNDNYMLFVDGERYEMCFDLIVDGEKENFSVVIDNSRGYWNMFVAYGDTQSRNTQTLVSTGNAAFTHYGYLSENGYQYGEYVSMMDKSMKSDVISLAGPYGTNVDIKVGAFTGIGDMELEEGNLISSFSTPSGVIVGPDSDSYESLPEDYVPGEVEFWYGGYHEGVTNSATLAFNTNATTAASAIEKTVKYLSDKGVKCRYNTSELAANADAAVALGRNFAGHYYWRGVAIKSSRSVDEAEAAVKADCDRLYEMYEEVKDLKEVEFTSRGPSFKGYDFATVTTLNSGTIEVKDGIVSVDGLSATVSNLKVFDAGENYTVNLALAKLDHDSAAEYISTADKTQSGVITLCDIVTLAGSVDADYTSAILMDKKGGSTTAYSSGKSMTLSQSATFTLPACDEQGVYTLVAYVATEDGIRVSEMAPVSLSSDVSYENKQDGVSIKMQLNEHDELIVIYSVDYMAISVDAKKGGYTYEEVKELLDNAVLSYAYPAEDAVIEIYPDDGAPTVAMPGDRYENCTLRINCVNKLDNSTQYVHLIIGE